MGKCTGYLLLTDMDGTLLSPESKVTKGNRKAINRFVEEGGIFGIATGRTHHSAWNLVSDLPVNCPSIVFNGCGIYDHVKGEFLFKKQIPLIMVKECLAEVISLYPHVGTMVFQTNRTSMLTAVNWMSEIPPEERPYFIESTISQVGDDIFKIVFTAEEDEVAELRDFLLTHPIIDTMELVLGSGSCLELLPKGISKGSALIWLRDSLGIKPENTLAIGDYENDAEMLKVAGISAAPENAHPDIIYLADIVVAHHGEDAVADFIMQVFNFE